MTLSDQLRAWETAPPGTAHEYHRGLLAADGVYDPMAASVGEAAAKLYVTGHYELAQRRLPDGQFSYLIIKRAARDPAPRVWLRGDRHERLPVQPHRPRAA